MTTQATRDSVSLGKVEGDEAEEAKAGLVDAAKNEGEADDVVDLAKVAVARSKVVAVDPADDAAGNEAAAVEGEGKAGGGGGEEGEAGEGEEEEGAVTGSVEAAEVVGGANAAPGDEALALALADLNAGVDKALHQEYNIDGKIVNPTPCLSLFSCYQLKLKSKMYLVFFQTNFSIKYFKSTKLLVKYLVCLS